MEFWQNQNGSFAGKLAPRSPAPTVLLYLRLLSSHRILTVIRFDMCARHSLPQLYARHIVPRNCLYALFAGQAAADSRLGSLLTCMYRFARAAARSLVILLRFPPTQPLRPKVAACFDWDVVMYSYTRVSVIW
jgi:hypothetical protein